MSTPTVTALSQPKYISDWESVGKNFSPEEAALLKTLTDAYEKRRRAGAVRALQNIPSGPLTGAVAAISPDTYANMAETELGGEAGTAASALEGLGMSAMGGVPASPALVEMLRIQGQIRNAPPAGKPINISNPQTEAEKILSLRRAMKRAEDAGIVFELPKEQLTDIDFIATPSAVNRWRELEAARNPAFKK